MEFARIAGSSPTNARRWLERLCTHEILHRIRDQWAWTPSLASAQRMDFAIRTSIAALNE